MLINQHKIHLLFKIQKFYKNIKNLNMNYQKILFLLIQKKCKLPLIKKYLIFLIAFK